MTKELLGRTELRAPSQLEGSFRQPSTEPDACAEPQAGEQTEPGWEETAPESKSLSADQTRARRNSANIQSLLALCLSGHLFTSESCCYTFLSSPNQHFSLCFFPSLGTGSSWVCAERLLYPALRLLYCSLTHEASS